MTLQESELLHTLKMAKDQIKTLEKMLAVHAGIPVGMSEITLNRIENEIAKIAFKKDGPVMDLNQEKHELSGQSGC